MLGGLEKHKGGFFYCHGGTQGCTDGQACTRDGALERHACDDGTAFYCQGGTQGCADESPLFCGRPVGPVAGGPEWRTCSDGTGFWCHAGTRDCHNDSPAYCARAGQLEVHQCSSGPPFACYGGTEGCYDDSAAYCSAPPCVFGTVAICTGNGYFPLT